MHTALRVAQAALGVLRQPLRGAGTGRVFTTQRQQTRHGLSGLRRLALLGIGHGTGIQQTGLLRQGQLGFEIFFQGQHQNLHRVDPRGQQAPRPRGHHGVFQTGGAGLGRVQADARLHVANAFGGERVAAQIRKAAAVVQTGRLAQLLKHADHALGVEPGLAHDVEAQAVGFTLHVP